MRALLQPRARRWLAPTAVVALAVATTIGLSGSAVADDRLVLDHGHVDMFELEWEEGELHLGLAEDSTGSHLHHEPEDVLLRVKEEAAVTLPASSFLGEAGETVYHLPQTQNPALLWPGWSTTGVPGGVFTNPLRIEVLNVEGPGAMYVWQDGSFGSTASVLSGGGYQLPGTILTNHNVHAHSNWAFKELGTYNLTVRASGDLQAGGTATSSTKTYSIHVGALPEPATSLSISGLASSYQVGDTATLTAVQDPQTDEDHWHWFTRAPGETEWAVVSGELTGQYSFTVNAGHSGRQVIARLYDHDHNQIAESPAVTLVVEGSDPDPDPGPGPGDALQTIIATLPQGVGALVVSVDADDDEVQMTEFELAASADHWYSSGTLRPVTVTDTRSGAPGWTTSGQVGNFAAGSESLPGAHLGWSPLIAAQPLGGGVTEGSSVAPGFPSGDGLSVSRTLASAPAGSGFGTSELGAGLLLHAPTDLVPGTYSATITFTAI